MKLSPRLVVLGAISLLVGAARAEFIPGHIFVSDFPNKNCFTLDGYHGDRIWEVNPDTGAVSLFAEFSTEEWCGGTVAMAFTPDGTKLRLAQFLRNRILELDENGVPSVVYDTTDGIAAPVGRNSITFDRQGNFYVASFDHITRFAPGADTGEIYADRFTDPLLSRSGGSLTIDTSGDLYFARHAGGGTLGALVRFQGSHNGSLFELLTNEERPGSIASDSCGNLFFGTQRSPEPSQLLRYVAGDSTSKAVLGEFNDPNGFSIGLHSNGTYVYIGTYTNREIFRLNLSDGSLVQVAWIPDIAWLESLAVVPVKDPPYGFTPCPPPIPTASTWGLAVLALGLLIAAKAKYSN